MSADAYATWFNVIGPTKSLEIANSRQIPVMFIVKNSNGIEFRQSNYW
jgi:thiamine biosynthesis lipoprotein ApbE